MITMLRPKSELEESLEFRDYEFAQTIGEAQKTRTNFYAFCGSIVERYKVGELAFHFHCLTNLAGSRSDSNLCIVAARSIDDMNAFSPLRVRHLSSGGMGTKNSEQHSSMFVDVAQCIEESEWVGRSPVLPIAVRLQSLDFCNCVWGNAVQPVPFKLVLESFHRRTDGEHVLFTGDIVRGEYQFPHQIIERGPQILKEVSDDKGDFGRDWGINLHSKTNAASIGLFLGHHYAWFGLKVPIRFGYERLAVMLYPDDFLSN
jgi:hypothetical protein